MCGIAGFLDLSPQPAIANGVLTARARAMAARLAHRGPDDMAVHVDAAAGLGLAFRRLAIVDLSPAGQQPMTSPARLSLVFNGEIYNHRQLRGELLSARPEIAFRGRSDTEVLLTAIEIWGLRPALERAVGMFALALWDAQTQTLSLARDRLGEKPLYYGICGRTLLFASELKALRAHPAFDATIERSALADYLRHGYIGAPQSIYTKISKLTPGSTISFSAPRLRQTNADVPRPSAYWSAQDAAERGAANPFRGTFDEATERLEALLSGAIADQMVADVPVGAFLSGGIDSSTVVALMQAQVAAA